MNSNTVVGAILTVTTVVILSALLTRSALPVKPENGYVLPAEQAAQTPTLQPSIEPTTTPIPLIDCNVGGNIKSLTYSECMLEHSIFQEEQREKNRKAVEDLREKWKQEDEERAKQQEELNKYFEEQKKRIKENYNSNTEKAQTPAIEVNYKALYENCVNEVDQGFAFVQTKYSANNAIDSSAFEREKDLWSEKRDQCAVLYSP